MGTVVAVLAVMLLLGLGVLAIAAILRGNKGVSTRPEELARAGAVLGFQRVPNPEAVATGVLNGSILHDPPRVASVVQGQTPFGPVTVVDTVFSKGGRVRSTHMQTVAVFHGTSGLPRLVIQPSGHTCPVDKSLPEVDLSQDEIEEALASFGYSFTLNLAEPALVGNLLTSERTAYFDSLEEAGRAPAIEVLPDRILFSAPGRWLKRLHWGLSWRKDGKRSGGWGGWAEGGEDLRGVSDPLHLFAFLVRRRIV